VQLLSTAVVFIGLSEGSPVNQKSCSRLYEPKESEPWTAFFVPSVPNLARIESGFYVLATAVLVGPMTFLHSWTAPAATSSRPIQTSLHINPERLGKKGFPRCSA